MTIRVFIRTPEDNLLSFAESRKYIKDFWMFNHSECCGVVDYQQMENFFIEMTQEYNKDSQTIDDVEYIEYFTFGGIAI